MSAYYNEIDPYAAQWLRNLIKEGLIADGEVDTRSIVDVQPLDLRGFTQCHFFAGIGGWSHALRLAGWPDDRRIWTGSCPCQPFSVAGKGAGIDDTRHLWPHFHRLITAVRPPVVMGEQVAGKAGYGWLDGVRADLAREGYASRGVDLPALAVNAPHIRQRLYWIALDMGNANDARLEGRGGAQRDEQRADGQVEPCGVHDDMAHADEGRRGRWPRDGDGERDGQAGGRVEDHGVAAGGGEDRLDMADASVSGWGQGNTDARGLREGDSSQGPSGRSAQHGDAQPVHMADTSIIRREERQRQDGQQDAGGGAQGRVDVAGAGANHMADLHQSGQLDPINNGERAKGMGPSQPSGDSGGDHMADTNVSGLRQRGGNHPPAGHGHPATPEGRSGHWDDHVWLAGSDGKARRVEPGLPLLAHGVSNRVGRLRAYGNAIVAPLAAEVIKAFMETEA